MKQLILICSLFFVLACDPEEGAQQIGDIFSGVGNAFTDSVEGAIDQISKDVSKNISAEFVECLNSSQNSAEAVKAKSAYDKWTQAKEGDENYEQLQTDWEQAQNEFLKSSACQK